MLFVLHFQCIFAVESDMPSSKGLELYKSVIGHDFKAVSLLLEDPKLDVNYPDPIYGNSLLCELVRDIKKNADEFDSNVLIFEMFLNHPKIIVKACKFPYLTSPLHFLSNDLLDRIPALILLKFPNLDINFKDFSGRTPLMIAASAANLVVAEAILQYHELNKQQVIQINLRDNSGQTAFHHAVKTLDFAIIDLLLKVSGIKVDIKDEERRRIRLLRTGELMNRLLKKSESVLDIVSSVPILRDGFKERFYKLKKCYKFFGFDINVPQSADFIRIFSIKMLADEIKVIAAKTNDKSVSLPNFNSVGVSIHKQLFNTLKKLVRKISDRKSKNSYNQLEKWSKCHEFVVDYNDAISQFYPLFTKHKK